MKKILLFVAALACSVASWAQNEVSATISSGKLTVSLDNETSYVAFQMDIALPEGVTVASEDAIAPNLARLDKNATVAITGSENSDFTIVYNTINSGRTLRVVAYNLQNREIKSNAGELFTVTLTGYAGGEITVDNIKFVTADALEEATLAAKTAVESGEIDPDANGDGKFDLKDVTYLLSLYVEDATYELSKVDFSDDGKFDLKDVTALLNLYVSE